MKRHTRSNEEWIRLLNLWDDDATQELRELLLSSAVVYLSQRLPEWAATERRRLAEDMAQESTMLVLKNISKFHGDSKFTTWAYSFVINLCASEMRLHRNKTHVRIDTHKDPMQYLSGILGGRRPVDAENMAERRDILAIVSGIIEGLPERQRIAVVNVCLRGLSTDVVAESLGLNRNAFYKLMHDARVTILAKLKSVHCLTLSDIYATFEE